MRDQARVVVIGGGIAGCSALYHLSQEGGTDVMLIERDKLTSGTTWHPAAQVDVLRRMSASEQYDGIGPVFGIANASQGDRRNTDWRLAFHLR